LPDAFTDYKGVMKSWNPIVNVAERVEVPKKTTQAPSTKKRGRAATTKKDNTSEKRPIKEKISVPQKKVNVSQLVVERHCVDLNDPQSSSQACYTNEAGTLEVPDDLILGNHEVSKRTEDISIQKHLSLQLMNVVTTYLYGSLDLDIYIKVPDGIYVPNKNANRNTYYVKLVKSLHGLK
jgi:hypothetical protein